MYTWGSNQVLTNITFSGNIATTLGGGIYTSGELSFVDCNFSGNQSMAGGVFIMTATWIL
jgi:predicted outer membrane repeat protein